MTPIADALVLTSTRRVGLRVWVDAGILEREWALYEQLAGAYRRVVLVAYGEAEREAELARRLHPTPEVVAIAPDAAPEEQQAAAARSVRELLADAQSVVVKTNQFLGGDVAIAISGALREAGKCAALIARGGYPWSRCEAWEHGGDSQQARNAHEQERRLLTAADLVIATTKAMARDLAWRLRLPDDRFRVVPNYVLTANAPNAPDAGESQREPRSVLFAGRLAPQKRVDLLIRAVAELAKRRAPADASLRLDVVGEGPLEAELRELSASLDAPVAFHPRENHDSLRRRMRRCAVYAQVSAYEGHPKTALEAMAAGAAVLVADEAPGLSSVVRHSETGFIADADPSSLADALELLLRDDGLRERLGAAAARRVQQRCALARVAELEREAHATAVERAGAQRRKTPSLQVRWQPELVSAPLDAQVKAWRDSLHGFQKRLEPLQRARFLMAIDDPLYQMQGEGAVKAAGGLHPKHRLMQYHEFFIKRVQAGERVLDLGCGNGALACAIARSADAIVVGVDFNEASIHAAQQRAKRLEIASRATFVVGDILELDIKGAFDVIVLSNVLEHLPGRARLLRRLLQMYQPRRVLIRAPDFERDWRVPWKRELGVEWRLDPTHEIEHRHDELARELEEAGLAPSDWIRTWGEHWVSAAALRRAC